MNIINAIYTLSVCSAPTQPVINEDSDVSITIANQSTCDNVTKWLKWIINFPVKSFQGVYNALLFQKERDFLSVVLQNYKGDAVTPVQVLYNSCHIISSPTLLHEIASRHFRSDPEGLFETPDSSMFLDLLQDLFPEYKKEISKEDFLFTCSRGVNTKELRRPFIEFFVKKNAREWMRGEIAAVTKEFIESIEQETLSQICVRKLTERLSVMVLSRLFLDPTLSLEECGAINRASSITINYWLMFNADSTQQDDYKWAKAKLRNAIQSSRGKFVEFLRDAKMSEIRILGTLMLVYIAGSETTSGALHSILWRLGQCPDIQNEIVKDATVLDSFVRECLREYAPVYLFTRIARKDLIITVKNKDCTEWQYPIAKGDRIMCSPYLAGKYLTEKDESSTSHKKRYPTKVFSEGPHGCPGMHLAEQEISSFILAILQKYVMITTPSKPNLSVKGMFTLKPEEVWLELCHRGD